MTRQRHKTSSAKTRKSASQRALGRRSRELRKKGHILAGARVYLSGPMDFVASREYEKEFGWRTRVSQFLSRLGVTVYDPWNKPPVAGLGHYGKEDEFTAKERDKWSYARSRDGDLLRAQLCDQFWPTAHIDLRMTDTADFLVAFCPTNVYSVGTVHEVVTARRQHKPVLLVTPPITFPACDELQKHLKGCRDKDGLCLLAELEKQAPLRPNPQAIPSLWYMAIIDSHYFFDGFGFARYMGNRKDRLGFNWKPGPLDEREKRFPPKRPLLPYLEKLDKSIPLRYDIERSEYVENPDWLIFK